MVVCSWAAVENVNASLGQARFDKSGIEADLMPITCTYIKLSNRRKKVPYKTVGGTFQRTLMVGLVLPKHSEHPPYLSIRLAFCGALSPSFILL